MSNSMSSDDDYVSLDVSKDSDEDERNFNCSTEVRSGLEETKLDDIKRRQSINFVVANKLSFLYAAT